MLSTNLVKTGFVALLSIILSLNGYAQQPTAAFTATPASGCAPLLVSFTDQSTGNPTAWRWDLGNGTVSQFQNPSVVYFTPGQYTVKLVVTNSQGADSVIRTQYIQVYDKPTVDFAVSSTAGCSPMTVNFSDLSTPGSGTNATWQWDFGDGNFSTAQNPTHTYTTTGNFNVSLLATNSHGCVNSITRSNYINITTKPTAAFTNSSTANCGAPLTIQFNNQSTGAGTLTYQWSFGDGNTSTNANPSHTYTTTGSFTVQLVTTNQNGCRDTIRRVNAINIANNITNFTAPTSVCTNSTIPLTNSSTPAPVSVLWQFGDGTTSTAVSPTKTYTTAGTYEIKMINNYGICIDSMTRTIIVRPQPVVDFSATPTSSCYAPLTVQFTNLTTGGATYTWNFGTGASSSNANPSYTYPQQGNYAVSLTATGSNGCSASLNRDQFVTIQLPVVGIRELPKRGCAPFEWTFEHQVLGGDSIVSYHWDFGDGTTSTLQSPTHVFDSGSYTIQLIIVTASGCTDTVNYVNGIRAGVRPQAAFSATPRQTCANIPVVFTDLSTPMGQVNEWYWDFGDSTSSINPNPNHIYVDTGFMDVMLVASNNGCRDTLIVPNYIYIAPPIAAFRVAGNCINRMRKEFTDESIGADSWNWNFGDGATSTEQNPVHVYATSGTYTVTLTVVNNTTGCSYTKTRSVVAVNQRPNFTATDTVVCKGSNVTFDVTEANPSLFSQFRWTFGDNTSGFGSSITKIYYNAGLYTVTLTSTDRNGCRDTVVKPRYIRVNGPTANFTSSVRNICSSNLVSFRDSSRSDGRNGLALWIWNYGDGQVDTTTTGFASHIYTIGGSFTVSLTVVDSSGCANTATRSGMVNVFHPVASFTTFDTLSCPGRNIQFNNTSTGSGLTYLWQFGDGVTSTQQSPAHLYAANGNYTVSLNVVDQNGCRDSATMNNMVSIVTPDARYTVSDTLGTCPPLIVNFTNNSLNYTSLSWNFGDGTNSSIENPSHFYATAGTFVSRLTVTGPGGCTSTRTRTIVVRGPSGTFNYGGLAGCAPYSVNFNVNAQNANSFVWDYSDGTTVVNNNSTQAHSYTVAGAYLPRVLLRDTAGCVVPIAGVDTIRVYDVSAGIRFNAPVFCNNGQVQFNSIVSGNDAITGYTWNFGDGQSANTANPAYTFTGSGTFFPQLIVQTQHGCRDTAVSTVPVRVVASPQPAIQRSANGCVSLDVRFQAGLVAPDTSNIQWSWSFGNGQTSTLQQPPVQTYGVAGQYPITLTATNSTGCVGTTTTTIEAYAIPVISAGQDTFSCKGTGVVLTATGGATYNWSPATGLSCTDCASPLANPNNDMTYVVIGTSIHGCSSRDTVKVIVKKPFGITVSKRDSLCQGNSLRISAAGAYRYEWSPAASLDNATAASPLASPRESTRYMVIGFDDKGCFRDTGYVPIVVFNYPTVEAGEDKTINVGQSIELMPRISADVIEARWSPTGSIFRDNFPGVTVKPRETTTYTVQVKNRGGCVTTDELTVNVLCNGANMFIPNTFSPNGDGMNDVFFPRGNGIFTIRKMKIFSRWGEVVFERDNLGANDASKGWDGTFRGRKLTPDVYVYVVEVTCDNNTTLTFKGNIALLK